ncbi:Threonine/homoserine/homoserine lactone efflux protein [Lutibacter agarilyticus]|uniref:Threonine/homoserine/homoserine lactone efflux protein n=1 Tax=Lutibacter agarilyticus TaxID=1109740 RepID=A0A238W168_9FLAO|nr:LysE family transporter [Lutibacter agarilyticus]SNR40141.1 Threonine/homoserine/homoserine lactone efflux protein [Lutibacter agarilyticus]
MTFIELKDAVLIGFFLAFMIGPVFFMLIQTSIIKGARAAIAFDVGVILGDIAFILIAYYGSKSLLEQIKDDPRLFFIGGLILLVYGIITYVDKSQKRVVQDETLVLPEKTNYVKLLLKGFLLNFINIGVLAFWLGMIVVIGSNLQMNPQKIFNYFMVILLSYFITDLGKILLAKQLKRKLTPTVIYKVKRGMGILLMVFGIALMLKGFLPKEQLNINNVIEQSEH